VRGSVPKKFPVLHDTALATSVTASIIVGSLPLDVLYILRRAALVNFNFLTVTDDLMSELAFKESYTWAIHETSAREVTDPCALVPRDRVKFLEVGESKVT
jgi:hypothetical protein